MTTTTAPVWTVGDRLRAARRRAGMKQAEAAQRIGVSRATVSNWEVGIAEPQVSQAAALAEVYGVPLGWIATGQDDGQDSGTPIILEASPVVNDRSPVGGPRLTRWEIEQRRWATRNAA